MKVNVQRYEQGLQTWLNWAALAVIGSSVASTGCGVKPPDSAQSPPPRDVATNARQAAPADAPHADGPNKLNPSLPAEAEDPAAHGSVVAKPASAPGNAAAKGQLIGALRTSLATGSGQLPDAFRADKIELRDANGTKIYSFKNKGADAVKFYDAGGQELCKLTVSTDKLKAKTAADQPLFELKYKTDKSSLRLPPDDQEAWKLKPRGDRLEIHTNDDRLAYVVRRDGAAVVLERTGGELVCRAETKGGSTTVTNAAGKVVISSTAIADPLGMVFFGWTDLDPSQQAACLVFYLRKNPT